MTPSRRLVRCIACLALGVASTLCVLPEHSAFGQSTDNATDTDPGLKQLTAANGLFSRGLFKLAADGYQQFLHDFPNHPQHGAGQYGLGISLYRQNLFAQAIDPLRQVLVNDRFEQKDEVLAVLGFCELSSQKYNDAISHFDELARKYPQSKQLTPAAVYRAQALFLAGRSREAADACRAFLKEHHDDPQRSTALYYLALSQKADRDLDGALQSLEELNRQQPPSAYRFDGLLLAGQILESQQKLDAAINRYHELVAVAPKDRIADARYTLGLALLKAGKSQDAESELKTVVNDFPQSKFVASARLELASALLADNKVSEARDNFQKLAVPDSPRQADAALGLAQCDFAEKKFDAALAGLQTLTARQPPPENLPRVNLYRGLCLMQLHRLDESLALFDKLAQERPGTPEATQAIYRSAYCLHELKRYEPSHQRCQQLAQLPSNELTAPAAELDAENLFLLGRYDEAQASFDRLAGKSNDTQKQLLLKLRAAQCDYFRNRFDRAIERLTPIADDPASNNSPQLRQARFLRGDAELQMGNNAQAVTDLRRFLESNPPDSNEARYKLGVAQLRAGDADAASASLEQLEKQDPASIWVQRGLLELAQLRYRQQRPEAVDLLNKLLAQNPPEDVAASAHYLMGWVRFDAKSFGPAASEWKTVIDKFPKSSVAEESAFQEGLALMQAGQLADATVALQHFTDAYPHSPRADKARELTASALTAQGKTAEAAEILAKLADAPAPSDTVLYDLAWSQRRAKQNEAAEKTYRRLLAQPGSALAPAARTELAEMLYSDKKYAEAMDELKKVVNDNKASDKVLSTASYRMAWCEQKLQHFDQAARAFAEFAGRWPNDELAASASLQAALAQSDAGHSDLAQQQLVQMLQKYPQAHDAPLALLKLAEVQAAEGDFAAAEKTDRDFQTKYPNDPLSYRAQFGVGWALENQKKYADARSQYQKVIAATNGETAARAQFQIGETWLAEQNYEQAVSALLAVEDVYAYPKWSARALFEAGRVFEQLKQPDQAKQQYSQLLNKYKDAPEAELAQDRLKAISGS